MATEPGGIGRHRLALRTMCRLCGQAVTTCSEATYCHNFATAIMVWYNVNILRDRRDIHPLYLCLECINKLQDSPVGCKSAKTSTMFEYRTHTEIGCAVCEMRHIPLFALKGIVDSFPGLGCQIDTTNALHIVRLSSPHGEDQMFRITVHSDFTWEIYVRNVLVRKGILGALCDLPQKMDEPGLMSLLMAVNSLYVCAGATGFHDLCTDQMGDGKFFYYGQLVAYEENGYQNRECLIRHVNCHLLLTSPGSCEVCWMWKSHLHAMRCAAVRRDKLLLARDRPVPIVTQPRISKVQPDPNNNAREAILMRIRQKPKTHQNVLQRSKSINAPNLRNLLNTNSQVTNENGTAANRSIESHIQARENHSLEKENVPGSYESEKDSYQSVSSTTESSHVPDTLTCLLTEDEVNVEQMIAALCSTVQSSSEQATCPPESQRDKRIRTGKSQLNIVQESPQKCLIMENSPLLRSIEPETIAHQEQPSSSGKACKQQKRRDSRKVSWDSSVADVNDPMQSKWPRLDGSQVEHTSGTSSPPRDESPGCTNHPTFEVQQAEDTTPAEDPMGTKQGGEHHQAAASTNESDSHIQSILVVYDEGVVTEEVVSVQLVDTHITPSSNDRNVSDTTDTDRNRTKVMSDEKMEKNNAPTFHNASKNHSIINNGATPSAEYSAKITGKPSGKTNIAHTNDKNQSDIVSARSGENLPKLGLRINCIKGTVEYTGELKKEQAQSIGHRKIDKSAKIPPDCFDNIVHNVGNNQENPKENAPSSQRLTQKHSNRKAVGSTSKAGKTEKNLRLGLNDNNVLVKGIKEYVVNKVTDHKQTESTNSCWKKVGPGYIWTESRCTQKSGWECKGITSMSKEFSFTKAQVQTTGLASNTLADLLKEAKETNNSRKSTDTVELEATVSVMDDNYPKPQNLGTTELEGANVSSSHVLPDKVLSTDTVSAKVLVDNEPAHDEVVVVVTESAGSVNVEAVTSAKIQVAEDPSIENALTSSIVPKGVSGNDSTDVGEYNTEKVVEASASLTEITPSSSIKDKYLTQNAHASNGVEDHSDLTVVTSTEMEENAGHTDLVGEAVVKTLIQDYKNCDSNNNQQENMGTTEEKILEDTTLDALSGIRARSWQEIYMDLMKGLEKKD